MKPEVSRWRWWIHFLLIGGYFVPGTVRGLLYDSHRPVLTGTASGLIAVSTANLIFFAIVFFLGWLSSRATKEELFLSWRPGPWVVPLGIGYSVAIRLGVFIVGMMVMAVLVIGRIVSLESIQSLGAQVRPKVERMIDLQAMQTDSVYYWLAVTLVSLVVGGLREEMWRAGTLAGMRALWPKAFGSRGGQLVAIVLIALVFGAGHLPLGITAAVAAALLGVFLGAIIIWHESIWPAVFAHGLFDAASFAVLPFVAERMRYLQ